MATFPASTSSGLYSATSGLILPQTGKNPKLHRKLAQVLAGQRDSKMLLLGDSIIAGSLSSVIGQGWAPFLASLLTSEGLTSAVGLTIPQVNTSAGTDSRFTLGSGWTIPASGLGPAGVHNSWGGAGTGLNGAVAAATFTFTPAAGTPQYNSYDIYYYNASVAAGFSANFNGGANTAFSQSTTGIYKATVSGTAASRPTLNLSTITGGFGCIILGFEPYNTAVPTLRIGNCGVLGTCLAPPGASGGGYWYDTTSSASHTGPLDAITAYAPDIVVINIGTNDCDGGIPQATFLSTLATFINFLTSGSWTTSDGTTGATVILHTAPPASSSFTIGTGVGVGWWSSFLAAGAALGVPGIDTFTACGGLPGFTALLNQGSAVYYADNLIHPTSMFDADIARIVQQALIQF